MDIQVTLVRVLVLVFSVVFHETAHGWAAMRLGDNTAKDAGRITLNPIPHISLMGSIIVPLVLSLSGSYPFGWAKPVPVNPGRLNNARDDYPKVAAAGPLSNFLLATISGILLGVTVGVLGANGHSMSYMRVTFFFQLFQTGVFINVVLALFNLIPIPPLDGSWILARFLSRGALQRYEQLRRYSMLIIVGIFLMLHYTPVGDQLGLAILTVASPFFKLAETVANLIA